MRKCSKMPFRKKLKEQSSHEISLAVTIKRSYWRSESWASLSCFPRQYDCLGKVFFQDNHTVSVCKKYNKEKKIFLMSMYDCLLVSALESVPIYVWKVWVSQPASPNDLRLLCLNQARVDFALHSSMRLIFSWQGTNLEPLPMILWFLVLFPLKTWAEKRMWGQTGC